MQERSDVITLAVSRGGFTGVAAEQTGTKKREKRAKEESRKVNQNELYSFRALLGTYRFVLWLQVSEKKKRMNNFRFNR